MKRIWIWLVIVLMLCGCAKDRGAEDTTAFSGGSGTSEDPYRISSPEDLREWNSLLQEAQGMDYASANYVLSCDIDLNGAKWEPIAQFSGVLDGAGFAIRGLEIRYQDPILGEKDTAVGLFGTLEGTVRNLTIGESSVSAKGESVYTGAFAGKVYGGTLENCQTEATVKVSGGYQTGGLCGTVNKTGSIIGCTNAAGVNASGTVGGAGGIAGSADCVLEKCANTGTVTAKADAAGIAVTANNSVLQCTNTGTVTAGGYAAGIVCRFSDGALNASMQDDSVRIRECTNTGDITSTGDPAGGIAVCARTGSIESCSNSGTVTAPMEVGGILAYFQQSVFGDACKSFTLTGCSNSGTVRSGENYAAGGICGILYANQTEITIADCTNSAAVDASGQKDILISGAEAGGILGEATVSRLEIRNCVNSGPVTGFGSAGGVAGYVSSDTETVEDPELIIARCVNFGSVYVIDAGGLRQEIYAGGILGSYRQAVKEELLVSVFIRLEITGCSNTGILDGDRETGKFNSGDLCGSGYNE